MIPQLHEHLQQAIFFIQASLYEQIALQEEYGFSFLNLQEQVKVGEGSAFFQRPVVVQFTFARYGGQIVCFYFPVSEWANDTITRNWIVQHYNPRYRGGQIIAIDNALNFPNVLDAIKEKTPPPPKETVSKEDKPEKKRASFKLV